MQVRVVAVHPDPLRGKSQPNDNVPDDADPVVVVLEGARHPGGDHQGSGDLREGGEPEGDVVRGEGRGEPRVIIGLVGAASAPGW